MCSPPICGGKHFHLFFSFFSDTSWILPGIYSILFSSGWWVVNSSPQWCLSLSHLPLRKKDALPMPQQSLMPPLLPPLSCRICYLPLLLVSGSHWFFPYFFSFFLTSSKIYQMSYSIEPCNSTAPPSLYLYLTHLQSFIKIVQQLLHQTINWHSAWSPS